MISDWLLYIGFVLALVALEDVQDVIAHHFDRSIFGRIRHPGWRAWCSSDGRRWWVDGDRDKGFVRWGPLSAGWGPVQAFADAWHVAKTLRLWLILAMVGHLLLDWSGWQLAAFTFLAWGAYGLLHGWVYGWLYRASPRPPLRLG